MIYRLNVEFFMLVNQTLLYSLSNNTNNFRFKLCKVLRLFEKKRLKGAHSLLVHFFLFCLEKPIYLRKTVGNNGEIIFVIWVKRTT